LKNTKRELQEGTCSIFVCFWGKHESRPLALVEKHEKGKLFKKHEKRSLKKAPRNT
jgi:hypothetical protein